jgi:hypothetical protein
MLDRSKRTAPASGAPASGGVALYLASKRPLDRARKRSRPLGSVSCVAVQSVSSHILKLKQGCEINLEGRQAGPPLSPTELDVHSRGLENVKQRKQLAHVSG